MKIAIQALRKYTELPDEPRAVRDLLDDVGIEVKRQEVGEYGPVFTVELLANRGDHYCYAGIAREVSGRTGESVEQPEVADLQVGPSPIPVEIQTPLCLVYTATLLKKTRTDELSQGDLLPLIAAGQKPIHPAVDATNLVNLEIGQPAHAFDADKIQGAIVVRTSRAGEHAWPLFEEKPREVPEGTLVIADEHKILAIAGVIGCEDSKATEASSRILLESATFDPVAVRKGARALGLHTDASARFERGSDPSLPLTGAGRVVLLLEQAGWQRVGTTGLFGAWRNPNRLIPLEIGYVASFLEHPLTEEEIRDRLSRYDFEVSPSYPDFLGDERWPIPGDLAEKSRERLRNTLLVRVPPHRLWDVEFAADIAEELAKSIGYNQTPQRLPPVDRGALPTPPEQAKAKVDNLLVASGFFEVFTDGFYGREVREKLGLTPNHLLWNHVETLNSIDRGYSLLKNNALAQAVETVATNLRVNHRLVRAYEWTRVFLPTPTAENGVCKELKLLWLVASGPLRPAHWSDDAPEVDTYFLTGLVEELAAELGLDLSVEKPNLQHPVSGLLHPYRQASITLGGKLVGILGEIHPKVCQNHKIKRERPVFLQLEASILAKAGGRTVHFVPPPETQPVRRDLAFTLPDRVTAGEIADALASAGPTWLTQVAIADRYDHEDHGQPVRTITYTLTFSRETALTTEELNQACEMLIASVGTRFGEKNVRLRA